MTEIHLGDVRVVGTRRIDYDLLGIYPQAPSPILNLIAAGWVWRVV